MAGIEYEERASIHTRFDRCQAAIRVIGAPYVLKLRIVSTGNMNMRTRHSRYVS